MTFPFSQKRAVASPILEAIFESLQDGIAACDASGVFTYVNPAALEMRGEFRMYLPDCELPLSAEQLPLARALRGERFDNLELKLVSERGGTRFVSVTGQPIFASEGANDGCKDGSSDGKPTGAVITLRDVSQHRADLEQLRRSEELYRTAVNSMSSGVVVQQSDGVISAYNPNAPRILGITEDQLLGRTSQDLDCRTIQADGAPFPGDRHPAMVTLRTGLPQRNVRMGLHHVDGGISWILINSEPIVAADSRSADSTRSVVATFTDITEFQNAEEALRRSERDLREAQCTASLGSWTRDGVTGAVTWSAELYSILGLDPAVPYPIESGLFPFVTAESAERLRPAVEALASQNTAHVLDLQLADGIRWVVSRGDAELDVNGKVLRWRGTVQDITHRKTEESARRLAEQTVRRSERRYREFVERNPAGVIRTTLDGKIVDCNPAFAEMLGFDKADELIGRFIGEFLLGATLRRALLDELRIAKRVVNFEACWLRRDGEERWFSSTINLAEGDPQGPFMDGTLIDITRRKRSELALLDSIAEKEVLLQEIHHRVKNNLQIVSSLLHMCSQSTGDAGVRELFRESENRVLSMAAIHECLYASSGFDVSDFGRIDLAGYLRRVVDNVAASYGHLGVLCSVEAEPDTSVPMGTAMPCGLIVNELVSNALKYAFESRSGRVRVSIQKLEATLLLRVDDDGAGLPESFQFGNTGGFGLQLVRALTKQLHGELGVHRENGTRFEIEFPIAVQSAPVIN